MLRLHRVERPPWSLKSEYSPGRARPMAGGVRGRTQNKITKRTQFGLCFQQNLKSKAKFQPPEAVPKPRAGTLVYRQWGRANPSGTTQQNVTRCNAKSKNGSWLQASGLPPAQTPEATQKDGPQVQDWLPPKNRRGRAKKMMDGSIIRSPIVFNKLGFVCSKHGGPHSTRNGPKIKRPGGTNPAGPRIMWIHAHSGVALHQQLFQAPDVQHPHTPLLQFGRRRARQLLRGPTRQRAEAPPNQPAKDGESAFLAAFLFGFPEQRSQGLVIPNIQINRHFPRPLLRRYLSSSSTLPASSTRSLSSSSSVVDSPASLSAAQPGSAPKRFAICRRRMVRSPS